MRFSIIIPNLNSPLIHRTIEALLPQCHGDAEVLVVGLDELGLVKDSSYVRFVSTGSPVFPATARNIGIRLARGEIFCFLDADCIPYTDWLARIKRWFDNPDIDVLGGGVDTPVTDYWMLADHISAFHDYLVTSPPGTRQQLPSLNLVVRRSALERVGNFDEQRPVGEDSDLTTRLRLHGYTLYFDPHVVVNHIPNRRTASVVLQHAKKHGYHSIKIDPRWRSTLRSPLPLRYPFLLLLTTPLLALAVTVAIYCSNQAIWRWWYVAPAVFMTKIAWCRGALEKMQQYSEAR